ncbi:MAG: phosphotransferase [Aestuariibacter sp.]|nr:phosphotransferase [Aestuariibacter sp.]
MTLEDLQQLEIWNGPAHLEPLSGGITNINYLATDNRGSYVVRIGEDIPVHQVKRCNELAASKAAHAAGLSPKVVHQQPGILVLEYIECQTLGAEQVRDQNTLERILPLVKSCHRDIPKYLRGAVLMFWVFHVVRDYAATLNEGNSNHCSLIPELLSASEVLEKTSNPTDIVFGHNDLLPANFLDDGDRLWLIDWDYAGFNSPLFDLGGLASNNGLSTEQETWVLENYFEKPLTNLLIRQYQAMKCASLLRETMWSMVSEIHSEIDFDYAVYTQENLAAFQQAYNSYLQT